MKREKGKKHNQTASHSPSSQEAEAQTPPTPGQAAFFGKACPKGRRKRGKGGMWSERTKLVHSNDVRHQTRAEYRKARGSAWRCSLDTAPCLGAGSSIVSGRSVHRLPRCHLYLWVVFCVFSSRCWSCL